MPYDNSRFNSHVVNLSPVMPHLHKNVHRSSHMKTNLVMWTELMRRWDILVKPYKIRTAKTITSYKSTSTELMVQHAFIGKKHNNQIRQKENGTSIQDSLSLFSFKRNIADQKHDLGQKYISWRQILAKLNPPSLSRSISTLKFVQPNGNVLDYGDEILHITSRRGDHPLWRRCHSHKSPKLKHPIVWWDMTDFPTPMTSRNTSLKKWFPIRVRTIWSL